ncbi:MAG: recombination regulator RecX [Acidobacteriota bacterium]|nr:recombination regulator RecX [Acidobacteriota bacterium]
MVPRRKLNADELWNFALKSLSTRSQSTGQLRVKLRDKAETSEDIDPLLARLKEYGYLDDKRFAESFAAGKLENAGVGRTRVLQELRGKRVAPALAENAVQRVYSETDETELIENFIRRKYRMVERDGLFRQDKDLASAYGRLRRAGFSSGNVVRVLKRFAADPNLLDALEAE